MDLRGGRNKKNRWTLESYKLATIPIYMLYYFHSSQDSTLEALLHAWYVEVKINLLVHSNLVHDTISGAISYYAPDNLQHIF